ncbi:MAG: hypothetical protein B6I18_08730 [Bacteroidetes bacterium 4572_112]|nr:MAG: hypothetical protein B6I18_08730 [Bacteroidetes bacterium 4572_112]
MKKLNILILLLVILSFGCSKTDFETGITGKVEYGEGDCMPIIDYESREYDNYNGDIYFIDKNKLDNLGNGDFEQLKANSIIISIKRGNLSAELAAGTYMVMQGDEYSYSEENIITINANEVLTKDFKFWKCTSY